jgi:hypothetical protein
VANVLRRFPDKDDRYIDGETGALIEKSLVDKDAENDVVRTIEEYRRLESLRESDRAVILDWKKGFTEMEIAGRHSMPKTTVHDKINRYRKSEKE